MTTLARERTEGPYWRKTVLLCGVTIEEPGLAMLLELFLRTEAGRSTDSCDLIATRRGPIAESYRLLDQLVERELVLITSAGRRFQRLEISPAACTAMRKRFPHTQ